MEELIKIWEERMVAYRKEADENKDKIASLKAMNKFFVYRDCIKELKQQLSLVKVSKRYTENDIKDAYDKGLKDGYACMPSKM
jgi:hypothetical protein